MNSTCTFRATVAVDWLDAQQAPTAGTAVVTVALAAGVVTGARIETVHDPDGAPVAVARLSRAQLGVIGDAVRDWRADVRARADRRARTRTLR
jgi:hypothetical protein